MIALTAGDEAFIVGCIRHAAHQYSDQAAMLRIGSYALGLNTTQRFRLADQFDTQAKRALDLADRIETRGLSK